MVANNARKQNKKIKNTSRGRNKLLCEVNVFDRRMIESGDYIYAIAGG